MHLEPGDIILSHEIGSGTSQLIALVSGSYWSHASLYLNDGLIIESVKYGVRILPFEEAFYNTKYIILRCKYLTQYQKERMIKIAKEYVNQSYDYAGCVTVLNKLLKRNTREISTDNAVMCSCLVHEIYKRGGLNLFPFNNYPLPKDFEQNNLLERVF